MLKRIVIVAAVLALASSALAGGAATGQVQHWRLDKDKMEITAYVQVYTACYDDDGCIARFTVNAEYMVFSDSWTDDATITTHVSRGRTLRTMRVIIPLYHWDGGEILDVWVGEASCN